MQMTVPAGLTVQRVIFVYAYRAHVAANLFGQHRAKNLLPGIKDDQNSI